MPPGDFQSSVGRQRAVWVQPGGKLVFNGEPVDIGAILIESGTALVEPFLQVEDTLSRWEVRIPIVTIPGGGFVLKAVATAHLAAIGWDDDADSSIWAIDEVHTEVDVNSQMFFVVPHAAYLGAGGGSIGRISYHVTIFLGGTDTFRRRETLEALERV